MIFLFVHVLNPIKSDFCEFSTGFVHEELTFFGLIISLLNFFFQINNKYSTNKRHTYKIHFLKTTIQGI